MIPILYTSNELSFTSNGIGRLTDCVSCTVTEERNGIYECEFQYLITGRFYQQMIASGGIIGVYHDDRHDVQPFDIYGFSAPIDGIVTFYAHHISYRLSSVMLKPFTATSVAETMVRIPQNSFNNNPFTFWTDKQTAANFKLDVPNCVRAILGGQQGSILDTFGGGDYEFDKFTVKLYDDRGTDTGVTIRYGKNLSDITYDKDNSGRYNAIAPYWKDGSGNVVYLPEIYVVSANDAGSQLAPWTTEDGEFMTDENLTVIEFNYIVQLPVAMDFSGDFQEQPTVEQLRQRAIQYLNANKPWLPSENVKVDFIQLWQSPEYESVAALQRVALCDYVSVYYPELGVVKERQKVIKTVYNVLLERFDSMEIGKPTTSLAQQILGTAKTETESLISDFQSVMQSAIDKATDLITGGLGGYVVFNLNADGQPQEILIMDTPDIETAMNVIRMNRNGIGFSTSGYQGPFRSAWTIDGAFNADFITAGTIDANIIRAGILSDRAGKNSWNLLTGDMSLTGSIKMSQDNVRANIGAIEYRYFYRQNWSSPAEIRTATGIGMSVDYGTDESNPNTRITLVPGTRNTRIIFESSQTALNAHYRDFISRNEWGMRHLFEEEVRDCIRWTGFDLDANQQMLGIEFGFRDASNYTFDFYSGGVKKGSLVFDTTGIDESLTINTTQSIHFQIDSAATHLGLFKTSQYYECDRGFRADEYGFEINSGVGHLKSADNGLYYGSQKIAFQSSSSLRYKHGIQCLKDPELDPHRLLDLKPRQFIYNEEHNDRLQYTDMRGKLLPGFIAEEVEDIYPSAVIHDPETGAVESWDERRIIPGMLALIQEQQKKIDDLEARLAKLERMVETLC